MFRTGGSSNGCIQVWQKGGLSMKLLRELFDLRESGIAEIIRFLLHPTFEGLIYIPLFILYNFMANMFAACSYIPLRGFSAVCEFIWEQFDDMRVELSRQHLIAIKSHKNLWEVKIFK